MDKEYIHMVCTCICIYTPWDITQPEEKLNYIRKMDGTGDHHAEQDKPSSNGQILLLLAHLWNLVLKR
jgi:hypothetical protein